jgi:hypothetical protein
MNDLALLQHDAAVGDPVGKPELVGREQDGHPLPLGRDEELGGSGTADRGPTTGSSSTSSDIGRMSALAVRVGSADPDAAVAGSQAPRDHVNRP